MWFHSPVLGELTMDWLTTVGSEPSNLNINRPLLLLTRITCYDMLNATNELYTQSINQLHHLTIAIDRKLFTRLQ